MPTDDIAKAREVEATALRLSQAQEKALKAYDLLCDAASVDGLPGALQQKFLHAAGHASRAAQMAADALKRLRAGGGNG